MNIYDLTFNELVETLRSNNIASFRAKQIWDWLYVKLVTNYEEMTNLDQKTIEFLQTNYPIYIPEVQLQQEASDGTIKVLLKLHDDEVIETVLMEQDYGYSVCVTSQIGCRIGCSFCASHLGGFKRNLTAGEIVAQVLHFSRLLKGKDQRVSHVVVMGIGEPMDNLANVLAFFDIINDHNGLNIGARHITISTSGIVPKIYEFSDYDKQVNLAVSLHAPNDKLRSQIMKINNAYPIAQLLESINHYIGKTNRRVSFEYIMLNGVNDSKECAEQLASLVKGMNCHINLIPFNSVSEYNYQRSQKQTIESFKDVLEQHHIQVTVRYSKGSEIDGACGQLRRKHELHA